MTEDMDALTFGTPYLLRGLNSKKEPAVEVCLKTVLEKFELTMDEFIDLCILCGCDYTKSIFGIGPVKAYSYIREHKTIEAVLEQISKDNKNPKRKKKFVVPENFLYEESRKMFKEPDTLSCEEMELKWATPDEDGLKEFLCAEKGFNEDNVMNAIKKLKKSKSKSNQSRLDCFFKKK
jgi:flap endonuclease-1